MRPARHWNISLVIPCVLAACWIPQGSGIAQLTAEELNLRIPDEQADAFADGTISAEEVEAAFPPFWRVLQRMEQTRYQPLSRRITSSR